MGFAARNGTCACTFLTSKDDVDVSFGMVTHGDKIKERERERETVKREEEDDEGKDTRECIYRARESRACIVRSADRACR